METCFTRYAKDSKRHVSLAINLSTSFLIALYPFPNAEGDRRGEEGDKTERGRSDDGGARIRAHAESSQFERVSGLKIVARGSRVT